MTAGAFPWAGQRLGSWSLLVCVLGALLLPGCAGRQAYDEGSALMRRGQVDEGLARLEEAVRLEPANAQYRIGLSIQRSAMLQRLFSAAEQARREGRLPDAEQGYRQVLRLDPNHAMARQGLLAMETDDRHRRLLAEAEALLAQGGAAPLGAAIDRVRAVLAADPQNKTALRLKERLDDVRTREQKTDTVLAEAYRRPITLQFNDVPLRTIFDAISRITGLGFFIDKDVRADARGTILARNTTVEDALRLLLLTNQLEQKVLNDNSVLVYPNTPQKQKDYQTLIVRSFFLANADVKAVSNAIKTIVKTKDMVVDERLGSIIMRDTADAVRMAERIVALQDLGDPEVMLEVEVLEVKRSLVQALGLQWPGQLTLTPLPSSGDTTTLADLRGLRSTTIGATLGSAIVNLNKQDQNANILTNPRIRVRNKEKAKILIGDRIPVITTTTSGTASFVSESVSYIDVGLKLEVEPTIFLDDEVAIKMNLEVSTVVKEVLSKSGTLSYQIGTRGASTVLRLKDGETQVLAGLISDEDHASGNKIPGLGDLPVLGRLFGSQSDDDQRSEILLSITPRVVRSLRRPDLASAEFESGTESAIGAPPLRLQRLDAAPDKAAGAAPQPGLAGAATALPATGLPATSTPAAAPAAGPRAGGPAAGFGPVSALPPAAGPGAAPRLLWQGPAQVRAGQDFSVLLRGQGAANLRELALQIGFDPRLLQVVGLRPGTLFDPASGNGSLLEQKDVPPGVLRVTLARPADEEDAGAAPVAPGSSTVDLLVVTFRALGTADRGAVTLRSADLRPAPDSPALLPGDHLLRVVP